MVVSLLLLLPSLLRARCVAARPCAKQYRLEPEKLRSHTRLRNAARRRGGWRDGARVSGRLHAGRKEEPHEASGFPAEDRAFCEPREMGEDQGGPTERAHGTAEDSGGIGAFAGAMEDCRGPACCGEGFRWVLGKLRECLGSRAPHETPPPTSDTAS